MAELASGFTETLFERLSQQETVSLHPTFLTMQESVRTSIARELVRLFDTRRPQGCGLDAGLPPTVLDYGLPDSISGRAANPSARDRLARDMTQAIEWFEPRLRDPEVSVLAPRWPGGSMVVQVSGDAAVGDDMCHVEFELDF
jgi:type VI secretion system lysozyme-like protein